MMTKTATMATAKCCQSKRGLSNMIFAFGARRKVCGAKERNLKAINKLCVCEILGLSFVYVELTFLNFAAGSREGTHAHCFFHACQLHPQYICRKLH